MKKTFAVLSEGTREIKPLLVLIAINTALSTGLKSDGVRKGNSS